MPQKTTTALAQEEENNAETDEIGDGRVAPEGIHDTTRPLILAYLALNGPMNYFDLEIEVRRRSNVLLAANQVERDVLDLYNASLVAFEGHLNCKLTDSGSTLGGPLTELLTRELPSERDAHRR